MVGREMSQPTHLSADEIKVGARYLMLTGGGASDTKWYPVEIKSKSKKGIHVIWLGVDDTSSMGPKLITLNRLCITQDIPPEDAWGQVSKKWFTLKALGLTNPGKRKRGNGKGGPASKKQRLDTEWEVYSSVDKKWLSIDIIERLERKDSRGKMIEYWTFKWRGFEDWDAETHPAYKIKKRVAVKPKQESESEDEEDEEKQPTSKGSRKRKKKSPKTTKDSKKKKTTGPRKRKGKVSPKKKAVAKAWMVYSGLEEKFFEVDQLKITNAGKKNETWCFRWKEFPEYPPETHLKKDITVQRKK